LNYKHLLMGLTFCLMLMTFGLAIQRQDLVLMLVSSVYAIQSIAFAYSISNEKKK